MQAERVKLKFSAAFMRRKTLHRGTVVSLIVGTILILINQGPVLDDGRMPALWQVLLTYLVPFLVSTISSSLADVQSSKGFSRINTDI